QGTGRASDRTLCGQGSGHPRSRVPGATLIRDRKLIAQASLRALPRSPAEQSAGLFLCVVAHVRQLHQRCAAAPHWWMVLYMTAVERERRTPIEAEAEVLTVFIAFVIFYLCITR